ncbi:ABC transporter ATP-binding protein [Anaeromicropila populeti]|uniref:ABC-2 type transport system ATP-binding protein n=1 Tax=Anaeromicropila populeti TaxID=37658 RepID=A0A1I6IDP0_9FIRM|nr:ABC transporter ATP-binding protein [Anaeromicropila populeti]SFR64803.1 ABC-2 type transport system ATP-binding protein [Anaeromicropila populeti]
MELVIDRITKQFKNKIAVDHVSLKLKEGVYGLLGANGAGKTTLMRMMCGLMVPDSGTIALDGISMEEEQYRDVLGYLPQDFGYYPDFTALEFLMYMASLKGIPKIRAKEKTAMLLEQVNLKDVAKKKIKTYSGGMKQRLGIAQALLNNPNLLVLDEPTAGLDPKERVKFRNMISELGKDRIVLLSTHIVSDVEYIADYIMVMKKGTIIHKGAREDILKSIDGKVWECVVPEKTALDLERKFPVINIRNEKEGIFLRLVCEHMPYETASICTASLEDLYLYYFSDEISEGEGQP